MTTAEQDPFDQYASELRQLDQAAGGGRPDPNTIGMQLPPLGTMAGAIRIINGQSGLDGKKYVRLIVSPPGATVCIDIAVEDEDGQPFAERIFGAGQDAAFQMRTGIVVPE